MDIIPSFNRLMPKSCLPALAIGISLNSVYLSTCLSNMQIYSVTQIRQLLIAITLNVQTILKLHLQIYGTSIQNRPCN